MGDRIATIRKVVNVSVGWWSSENGDIEWLDRAFDYWIRERDFTVAAIAHNQAAYIKTPGKAWNVITVGGSNDQNSVNWSDDGMYNNSNYIDPINGESGTDREKPEVVAPAVDIIVANGDGAPRHGTSYAAPQVAGLAALLIQRNSQLQIWPEAVKAILMASAVHNIEGSRRLSEYDGTGAIDAPLADQIAQTQQAIETDPCNFPCWWGVVTGSSTPGVGGTLNRYFNAIRGERIRVAISWMSNADSEANNYSFDRLDTDFDLRIYNNSDNSLMANSLSFKNNYEIVEFVAPSTATYRIEIKKQSATESTNSIGIAWTKQATYLPDVRNNNGWLSSIYVRNDGAVARPVKVTFLSSDGTYQGEANNNNNDLAKDAVYIATPPANWSGSAIVDGSEDLSVEVTHEASSRSERTSYTGIVPDLGTGSPGWEKASPLLYEPTVKRSYYGRSTTLIINHVGAQQTTVTVRFYDDAGTERLAYSGLLNPGQTLSIPAGIGSGSGGCGAANTICSAKVSTSPSQLLAMVATEIKDSGTPISPITHNSIRTGTKIIYFPVVKHKYYNNSTGLRIQNVGSAATDITVAYYGTTGTLTCSKTNTAIAANAATTFVTDDACPGIGFWGSVVISSATQPLVGMTNEASADGRYKKDYSSFHAGGRVFLGQLVYNGYNEDGLTWNAGIGVQNLSSSPVNLKLYYFNSDGTAYGGNPVIVNGIEGNGMRALTPAPPAPFKGSVIVTADQDITVMLNVVNNAATGDSHASYNASGR
ncbi:MAG: S8 family serine peptidase [Caldilineaceae bacterium]